MVSSTLDVLIGLNDNAALKLPTTVRQVVMEALAEEVVPAVVAPAVEVAFLLPSNGLKVNFSATPPPKQRFFISKLTLNIDVNGWWVAFGLQTSSARIDCGQGPTALQPASWNIYGDVSSPNLFSSILVFLLTHFIPSPACLALAEPWLPVLSDCHYLLGWRQLHSHQAWLSTQMYVLCNLLRWHQILFKIGRAHV